MDSQDQFANRPRNLVIAGVPRSGKSGLCREFARQARCSHLAADSIVSSMADVFPELGIHHGSDHSAICRRLKPLLASLIDHYQYEKIRFILDIYHLLPADAVELFPRERFVVLFLGYPNVDAHQKCAEIRMYDTRQSWTAPLTDAELRSLVERYIDESEKLEQACAEKQLGFLDVSERSGDLLSHALLDLHKRSRTRLTAGD